MKIHLPKQTPRQAKLIELIVIFNVVGLTGFAIPATRHIFMLLTPWHLLVMGMFMLMSHTSFGMRFLLFFILTYVATFAAEWVGVHTGVLFGNYDYGHTMGCKLLGIPLIMGITWFLLVYCAGVAMQWSRVRNIFFRVFIGAILLVLLDLLIEPVAMRFDYWHWANGIIPIKNYGCWLMVSAIMLFVFEAFQFKKQSLVAPALLLMQFVFFGLLNLI